MAKHQAVKESEIKTAIQAAQSAIMNRKRPDAQLRRDQGARLMALRGKLEKQLQPLFAKAGLDIATVNKILAEYQNEVGSVLEKEKTKYAKTFAALNKNLRRGIENQRKALEQIAFRPVIRTPIPLWTAFDIVEDPGNIPFQSHIEASNNWAVTTFETGKNTQGTHDTVDVYFWFAWQNPSQDFAVLNAESNLVLQGTCRTVGNSHVIFSGDAWLDSYAELVAYTGIAPISGGFVPIKFRESGWPGDPPVAISGTFHLPGPPGGFRCLVVA